MKIAKLLRNLLRIEPEKPIVWTGTCALCGGYIESRDRIPNEDSIPRLNCYPCVFGVSREGKARQEQRDKEAADRKQIELYKIAIREVEDEKK